MATKTKIKTGLAVLVTDRSGSMLAIQGEAQGSYDTYVEGQAKLSAETDDLEVQVMLIQFDNIIEKVYGPVDVAEVPDWTLEPRGLTALYDAIGQGIQEADKARKEVGAKNNAVSLIIVTDGFENASKEFGGPEGQAKIKELVKQKQDKGWNIQFLAGDLDAAKFGRGIGVMVADWSPQVAGSGLRTMGRATGQSMGYLATNTSSEGKYENFNPAEDDAEDDSE